MSNEVLSQSEIDALLSAISAGEMDAEQLRKEDRAKKVKVYDFKRALRFSKDQIRSLTRIHENFARLLTTHLSAQLRTYVQISVASVDQIPYEEFIRSIPNMTFLNIIEVPPLAGRVLFELNPKVAYAMLDRRLGGTGSSVNKVDTLTEIETKLITDLVEKSLDSFEEAWSSVAKMKPQLSDFEVNPQFLQMVSPNETVVVVSLTTQIGDVKGMINICLPHVVLEPIVSKLSMHYWMQSTKKEPTSEETELLKKRVYSAELPIVAELGQAKITIEDFLSLGNEDVICLDQSIGQPLTIKVNHIPKFKAQAGKMGRKMAVQVLEKVTGGESDEQ